MLNNSLYKYIIVLPFILVQYCFGQDLGKDYLFNKFRQDIQIEEEEHGRVVWDDETREAYYLLLLGRSIEALVKNTDDSMPAVRSLLFAGLFYKKAEQKLLKDIFLKHFNDTAKFILGSSDVFITYSVKEYMQSILDFQNDSEIAYEDLNARLDKIRHERFLTIAAISGVHHGIILKDSLLKADSLFIIKSGFKIISFNLTFIKKTLHSSNFLSANTKKKIRKLRPGDCTFHSSNFLSANTKKKIGKLRPGDCIFIENIKAEGPDKILRTLGSTILKIK